MYNNQFRDFEYVKANLNFDGVDWQSMIDNSLAERRIKDDFGLPVTKFGKSLLQVCIDNEDSRDPASNARNFITGQFQLRELMIRLLRDYKCDVNKT
jgi:hypothetical protein